MLGSDVVSNHSTPDIGSRCPLDTEALHTSVSAASLIYHVWHRFSACSIGFGGGLKYLSVCLALPAPDGAQTPPGAQFRSRRFPARRFSESSMLTAPHCLAKLEAVRARWLVNQTWSALNHYNKGLGRHAGVWVHHAKPVTNGCPNSAWVMNWPACSVLVGTGKSSHWPPCQRCSRRKGLFHRGTYLDSNGFEGPGRVRLNPPTEWWALLPMSAVS